MDKPAKTPALWEKIIQQLILPAPIKRTFTGHVEKNEVSPDDIQTLQEKLKQNCKAGKIQMVPTNGKIILWKNNPWVSNPVEAELHIRLQPHPNGTQITSQLKYDTNSKISLGLGLAAISITSLVIVGETLFVAGALITTGYQIIALQWGLMQGWSQSKRAELEKALAKTICP